MAPFLLEKVIEAGPSPAHAAGCWMEPALALWHWGAGGSIPTRAPSGGASALLLVWQGGEKVTPGHSSGLSYPRTSMSHSPQKAQLPGDHPGMLCSRCQEATTE